MDDSDGHSGADARLLDFLSRLDSYVNRLLAEDVLARLHRLNSVIRVHGAREAYRDDVDVRVLHHFVEIRIRERPGITPDNLVHFFLYEVADRDKLAPVIRRRGVDVRLSDAESDHRVTDLSVFHCVLS